MWVSYYLLMNAVFLFLLILAGIALSFAKKGLWHSVRIWWGRICFILLLAIGTADYYMTKHPSGDEESADPAPLTLFYFAAAVALFAAFERPTGGGNDGPKGEKTSDVSYDTLIALCTSISEAVQQVLEANTALANRVEQIAEKAEVTALADGTRDPVQKPPAKPTLAKV